MATGLAVAGAALVASGFTSLSHVDPAKPLAAAEVQLDMATLHAAALSAARSPRDTTDAPYLMVTVFGPGVKNVSKQLPSATAHWTIKRNEAKSAEPLASLSIAPGDSVRVLFTLLENEQVNASDESQAGAGLMKMNMTAALANAQTLATTLSPVINHGAQWLGSAAMLLTNEGGKTYWRALDCVKSCSVSSTPVQASGSELTTQSPDGLSGVLELNGNSATYHLKVTAKRSKS